MRKEVVDRILKKAKEKQESKSYTKKRICNT